MRWYWFALIAFAVVAAGGTAVAMNIPRGLRNNNPGNILKTPPGGKRWDGEIDSDDPRFAKFRTMADGVRALARLLLTYRDKYGLETPAAIIARWAPPSENNTGAYAAAVAKAVGVGVNDRFDVRSNLGALVLAIARHENGAVAVATHLPNAALAEGVARALA